MMTIVKYMMYLGIVASIIVSLFALYLHKDFFVYPIFYSDLFNWCDPSCATGSNDDCSDCGRNGTIPKRSSGDPP